MNEVKLKIDPFTNSSTISINGVAISRFSRLANYLFQPFFAWAEKFLVLAEEECNDDFNLTVISTDFDKELITALNNRADSGCMNISHETFSVTTSISNRVNLLMGICSKYQVTSIPGFEKMRVYSELPIEVEREYVDFCSDPEGAQICILKNTEGFVPTKSNMFVFCVGSISKAEKISKHTILWSCEQNRLQQMVSCATDRIAKVKYIAGMSDTLNAIALSSEDRELVKVLSMTDPIIEIDVPDHLDYGERHTVGFTHKPLKAVMPSIFVDTANPEIIEVAGYELRAVGEGRAQIGFWKGDESTPFCTKNITVARDNKVRSITLQRDEPNMEIGNSQIIHVSYEPADALDGPYLIWRSSDENIALVDESGKVTAISDGRVIISVSSSMVSESVIIDVLPFIHTIDIPKSISLVEGKQEFIDVKIHPSNAADAQCVWESDDPDVAYVESTNNASYAVGVNPGICNLTCKAVMGSAIARCKVTVKKRFLK